MACRFRSVDNNKAVSAAGTDKGDVYFIKCFDGEHVISRCSTFEHKQKKIIRGDLHSEHFSDSNYFYAMAKRVSILESYL